MSRAPWARTQTWLKREADSDRVPTLIHESPREALTITFDLGTLTYRGPRYCRIGFSWLKPYDEPVMHTLSHFFQFNINVLLLLALLLKKNEGMVARFTGDVTPDAIGAVLLALTGICVLANLTALIILRCSAYHRVLLDLRATWPPEAPCPTQTRCVRVVLTHTRPCSAIAGSFLA